MKKIASLAVTIIIVFCIAPIASTQAMPRQVQINENVVYDQLNEFTHLFNQDKYCETIMAKSGIQKDLYAQSNDNPYVRRQGIDPKYIKREGINPKYIKREGQGRSKIRDKNADKDDDVVVDNGDVDGDDAGDEGEPFGDNSAIKFNKDLENTSGYNEDL